MVIKRIALAFIFVLGFGTLNAMDAETIAQAKELITKALVDQTFHEPFKKHFESFAPHGYDVDALEYEPGKTFGQYIDQALASEHTKVALGVAGIVEEFRTNRTAVFCALFQKWLHGDQNLEGLKTWLRGFEENIDEISYSPTEPGKTVGQFLTDMIVFEAGAKDLKKLGDWIELAGLLQQHRTDKAIVLQTLFKAWEQNPQILPYLVDWIEYFVKNNQSVTDVDKIACDPAFSRKTIGDRINELLMMNTCRKKALALAKAVEEERSNHEIVIQTLYKAYETDPSALEEIKDWVEGFEEDIDRVEYDPANPGKTIGMRIADFLCSKEQRSVGLAIAKVMQADRSDKDYVLRVLFKCYEKDPTAFDALKEWQEYVKSDVQSIQYNVNQPETIAERIDALKNDGLSKLFSRPVNSTPSPTPQAPAKAASWSTGKSVCCAALLVGGGLVYYYMKYKDPKGADEKGSEALTSEA